jgi:diaminopropionate ammonia-lyase
VAGVAAVHYKDESARFGLGSFKPLGGAYAVIRLLINQIEQRIPGSNPSVADILDGRYTDITADITVTAATDGNHGRAVAWGARLFGCCCVIFIHETVTPGREQAIKAFGAEVRRNPGTFDDAVRTAQDTAQREGWFVIPDTSDGSLIEAPVNVMRGYTLLVAEALEQLPYDGPPTHLFLQAGVGGMAAATVAQLWQVFGTSRPRVVLVEPKTAACWYLSLEAGRLVTAPGELHSIMAGLACGEVSQLAWMVLAGGACAAMKINDAAAADCMRLLADGRYGDPPLVAGESAVAGLAGLLAVAADPDVRRVLALDGDSRVLLFGTEGATDPDTYRETVGRSAEAVAASQNPPLPLGSE